VSFPVPMVDRQRRLPTAGRIRAGITTVGANGKIKPKALDTFRFTSRRREDLDVIASLYGGVVTPWSHTKSEDKFEIVTDASEVRVALPPDALGDGSFYELWGGKGLLRRCDGIHCEVPVDGPDGREMKGRSCLCRERNVRECKPKLRLSVLLPEVSLRGTWRLDTGSELALDEIPGVVELLDFVQSRQITYGLLRLERRQSQGGRNSFVVPCLGIAESLEGLLAGRARLTAGPALPQIEAGAPANPPRPVAPASARDDLALKEGWAGDITSMVDDEVVDAEIVEEEPSAKEKARLLKVARARAILDGTEPPQSWEDI
jgi:hypothetical protein